ncbi:uncharacterized protein ACIB01_009374 [Guaruba guarouba]
MPAVRSAAGDAVPEAALLCGGARGCGARGEPSALRLHDNPRRAVPGGAGLGGAGRCREGRARVRVGPQGSHGDPPERLPWVLPHDPGSHPPADLRLSQPMGPRRVPPLSAGAPGGSAPALARGPRPGSPVSPGAEAVPSSAGRGQSRPVHRAATAGQPRAAPAGRCDARRHRPRTGRDRREVAWGCPSIPPAGAPMCPQGRGSLRDRLR